MKRIFIWSALAVLIGCAGGVEPVSTKGPPPNIVLIISDDQAWGDYGFMGHPTIETPRIDQLASESLLFTRGYVPTSLCRPSLATIVTGRYPHEHRIVGNNPPGKGRPGYLQRRNEYLRHIDRVPTLATLLKEKGYLSHQSGKWWEGSYSRGGFTHGMTHGDRTRDGRHGDRGLKIGRKGMKPIFDFLETATAQEKPFFLYYAPFLPHTPHNPPKRLLDKYRKRTPHLAIAKYQAMCEWFDETVGTLLDHLAERGLDRNTLVVYVTDNGWINRTDRSRYAPRSKRSPYDGGLRTPISLRWPGRISPRKDSVHLAGSIDLVPTILTAVGMTPDPELPGINLLDDAAVAARPALFGELFEHDVLDMDDPKESLQFRWIIRGDWKLIVPNPIRKPKSTKELFHLAADPHERVNLADREPDRVAKLATDLDRWWK